MNGYFMLGKLVVSVEIVDAPLVVLVALVVPEVVAVAGRLVAVVSDEDVVE
jgi:hypothetical protein